MSIMRQSLKNWLKPNISIMCQGTVCDTLPEETRNKMVKITMDSGLSGREMGAPIDTGYALGKVTHGTYDTVPIIRNPDTIGTFHTHTRGHEIETRPSTKDVTEMITHNDKIMCIGYSGKIGQKIQCFTPLEPAWSRIKTKIDQFVTDAQPIREQLRFFGDKIKKLQKDHDAKPEPKISDDVFLSERRFISIRIRELEKQYAPLLERRSQIMEELDRHIQYISGYPLEQIPRDYKQLLLNSCKVVWEALPEFPELAGVFD